MLRHFPVPLVVFAILLSPAAQPSLFAQGTPAASPAEAAPLNQANAKPTSPAFDNDLIAVPTGTRLPLMLRNGINTRTAKAGDSVYFETAYPIAQNNRIVIPMGSFVRGKILESKRPGLIKGRGEFRMVLEQMTFPNGYTVSLAATPSSADRDGREGVDAEGKIVGPSGSGRDKVLVLATTAGGAYIGTLAGVVANGAPVKGALIGGGAGVAAGLIAILLTCGPEAELPRGTMLDVVFDHPLVLDSVIYRQTSQASSLSPSRPPQFSRKLIGASARQAARYRASRFLFFVSKRRRCATKLFRSGLAWFQAGIFFVVSDFAA